MKTKFSSLMVIGFSVFFLILAGGCAKPPQLVVPVPVQYTGLTTPQELPPKEAPPKLNAPVIKNAFAIDRGRYGSVLKIYLEAEDPNGDMAKIVTTVLQPGYGYYPTDWIVLKPPFQKSFRGYIQWNTFSSAAPHLDEWDYIWVRVAVMDRTGNLSNEFEFPFTFETGAGPVPVPPAPFDNGTLPKLGNISINLFNPHRMGGGTERD